MSIRRYLRHGRPPQAGGSYSLTADVGSYAVTGSAAGLIYGGSVEFVDHPRLYLTDAKLTELIARKNVPTAEYTAMKNYADLVLPSDNSHSDLTGSMAALGGGRRPISSLQDWSPLVAGTVAVISAKHALSNGVSIDITGTTNYNGTYTITVIHADAFYITVAWAESEIGFWNPAGALTGTFTVVDATGFPTTSIPTGTISAFSDYSGTVAGTVRATQTAHGLSTGNAIRILNPFPNTDYNGEKAITVIDANSFYFSAIYSNTFSAIWDGTHNVRINTEALTVTRSGNTFTVYDRNVDLYGRGTSGAKAHASGATVWKHAANLDTVFGTFCVSLLRQLGVAGYDDKARNATNLLMYFFSAQTVFYSNEVRHTAPTVAMAYDWNYDLHTADDKTAYAAMFHEVLNHYIVVSPYFVAGGGATQSFLETFISNNAAAGYLRGILMLAAAIAGDDGDAETHWLQGMDNAGYLRSALLGGAVHGGVNAEGSEYSQTDWSLYPNIFEVIATATDEPTELSDIVPWIKRWILLLAHITTPGASNSSVSTTGSIAAGSTSLVCADASSFVVGENINVGLNPGSGTLTVETDRHFVTPTGHTVTAGDIGKSVWIVYAGNPWRFHIVGVSGSQWEFQAVFPTEYGDPPQPMGEELPWYFGSTAFGAFSNYYVTSIVAKAGNTITTRDAAPGDSTSLAVSHHPTMLPFGDVETTQNYDDYAFTGGEVALALAICQDILVANGETAYAEYAEHLLDTAIPGIPNYFSGHWFLWRQPSVSATDYTAVFAENFVTDDPDSFGVLVANSDWTPTRTSIYMLAGGDSGLHTQSNFGTFGIRRNGVWLTRSLVGYNLATTATLLYYEEFGAGSRYAEMAWMGARFHNSIQMNQHSALNQHLSGSITQGPSTMARAAATSTYAYGRCDASNVYRGDGFNWLSVGYPNNDARTWLRDFLVINPDLVFIHDRTTYANASTSPTRWSFNYRGDPSISSQRVTTTYAGQKLVQDILLPTSADLTEYNYRTEQDGAFDGYRIEVESGVSASTEYGSHVIQVMASADSPATVTTLTGTNANVHEIATSATYTNGVVVGAVKGTTPTLNIVYTYVAADPDHYLLGFVPSTAYHVDNNAGTKTVTISTATGSGDTTSTAAGMLVF